MRRDETGKLLRIFIGERDRWKGQPLHTALLGELRSRGFMGATVVRGIEGFGGHSVVHAARIFDLTGDLPVIVEVVDTEERIRALLPLLDEMVGEGLVTLESVEIIRYGRDGAAAPTG